jgi:hypothetical protein
MNEHNVFEGAIFKGVNAIASKDDLRPVMGNAIIDKGHIVCTDAHQLIKINLTFFGLDQKSIDILEGTALDRELLTKLGQLKRNEKWFISEAGFNIIKSNGKVGTIFPLGGKDDEGKYPNYEAVIPTAKSDLDTISLNPQLLLNIEKIFEYAKGEDGGVLEMQFHGGRRACTLVNKDNTFLGLVMPRMLNK